MHVPISSWSQCLMCIVRVWLSRLHSFLLQSLLYLSTLILIQANVLCHLLQVYLVVKVDDVPCFAGLLIDHTVSVDLSYILRVVVEVSVAVNDTVETNSSQVADLGYRVNGAHYELVHMSLHEKIWLATQHTLRDGPDYFLILRVYLQHVAKFDNNRSRSLQDSAEETIVRNQFLSLFFS